MKGKLWTQERMVRVKQFLLRKQTCPKKLLPKRLPTLEVCKHLNVDDDPARQYLFGSYEKSELGKVMRIREKKVEELDFLRVGDCIYIYIYNDRKFPEYFHLAVLRDLVNIYSHRSGKRLIDSINRTENKNEGRELIIGFANGFSKSINTVQKEDGTWTGSRPGNPAEWVKLDYNPFLFGLPYLVGASENPWKTDSHWGHPRQKPPDVTLFHELVHADDFLKGVFNTKEVNIISKKKTKLSELRAVGLPPFIDPSIISENTYRVERGVNLRNFYTHPREIAWKESLSNYRKELYWKKWK